MKVQIYTMQSIEEAREAIALGVDLIGLTPSTRGLPGEISNAQARAIRDAVRGTATVVALSVEEEVDDIVAMVREVQPDVLHLCGDIDLVGPDKVREVRAQIGEIQIMQAIPMVGPEAVAAALAFAPLSDYLILDSAASHIDGIGATGHTHDWSISAAIVEQVDLPVILAGGLNPDNVAEAIAAVKPWAVDSLTHTNKPLADGGFVKDLDAIERFVQAARAAEPVATGK